MLGEGEGDGQGMRGWEEGGGGSIGEMASKDISADESCGKGVLTEQLPRRSL